MQIYTSNGCAHSLKTDQSPVTQADIEAHVLISTALDGLLPDCPVVSEEDADSLANRTNSGMFWLLDPLDGTKEFIDGNGEFTVNIALIKNGAPILGVVYAPAKKLMYWGGLGIGAFRDDGSARTKIHANNRSHASSAVTRVVASKSHLNQATVEFIKRIGNVSLVQAGSSLKICRIAEGAADIYPRLGPTCEWDTAAAQAVLEGAGGVLTDLHGVRLAYGKPDVINPYFVAAADIGWLND